MSVSPTGGRGGSDRVTILQDKGQKSWSSSWSKCTFKVWSPRSQGARLLSNIILSVCLKPPQHCSVYTGCNAGMSKLWVSHPDTLSQGLVVRVVGSSYVFCLGHKSLNQEPEGRQHAKINMLETCGYSLKVITSLPIDAWCLPLICGAVVSLPLSWNLAWGWHLIWPMGLKVHTKAKKAPAHWPCLLAVFETPNHHANEVEPASQKSHWELRSQAWLSTSHGCGKWDNFIIGAQLSQPSWDQATKSKGHCYAAKLTCTPCWLLLMVSCVFTL